MATETNRICHRSYREGYGQCLLDEPDREKKWEGRSAGEEFNDDKQCEFVFGPGSRICPYMVSTIQDHASLTWLLPVCLGVFSTDNSSKMFQLRILAAPPGIPF